MTMRTPELEDPNDVRYRTLFRDQIARVLTDEAKRAIAEARWYPANVLNSTSKNRRADLNRADGALIFGCCPIAYGLSVMGATSHIIGDLKGINDDLAQAGATDRVQRMRESDEALTWFIIVWDEGRLPTEDLAAVFGVESSGG